MLSIHVCTVRTEILHCDIYIIFLQIKYTISQPSPGGNLSHNTKPEVFSHTTTAFPNHIFWYHIGNVVSCHTLTFISFIQIYVVSETSKVTLMLTQWMGLSYHLHRGVRKSRSLSEVAAVFEPVPSNILGHMYMSIVLVRSRSPVRPSTCHLVEGSYTFQKWSILFSSLCPSSLYVQVIAASWPVSTVVVGRAFCLQLLLPWSVCLWFYWPYLSLRRWGPHTPPVSVSMLPNHKSIWYTHLICIVSGAGLHAGMCCPICVASSQNAVVL